MRIMTKVELKKLMESYPNGGIVFSEYESGNLVGEIHITDGSFGARTLVPEDGEVFDYDWSIGEYGDDELFAILDNNDILQMIQTLTAGLKIDLTFDFSEGVYSISGGKDE